MSTVRAFLGIFVWAFAVRLVYLFQIEAIPVFYRLGSDGRSYDLWAQRLANGEWLGREVFYQAPLYPYFLGVLQVVLGHDLWWIRVVQMALGAASCGLLYLAVRSLFSHRSGLAAGLLLSVYAPSVFLEGLIQKSVLDLFLVTLLLLLLVRTQLEPSRKAWVGAGAVLALLVLARENALVLALVIPVWIWVRFSPSGRRTRAAWIGCFAAGLALVLLAVGLRNLRVGGELVLTTSQLGPNFFIGNNADADGTYIPLTVGHGDPEFERRDATRIAERALGRALTPGEVSDYWLKRSWDYIRTEPLGWLRLMAKKAVLVWNVHEVEDAEDYYAYQEYSPLLHGLGRFFHFGVLFPVAAAGIVLTRSRWRELWLLYALLITLAASVAVFYVFARYRFPLVPILAAFAGAGLNEAYAAVRRKQWRRCAAAAAALVVTAIVAYLPVIPRDRISAAGYNNLANAMVELGRVDEAVATYRRVLADHPDNVQAHYNLGSTLAQRQQLDEARRHLERTVELAPDYAEAHNNLGSLLRLRGDRAGAVRHYRRALELEPDLSYARLNLAAELMADGQLAEAKEHYLHVLGNDPDSVQAQFHLGRIRAAEGDLESAVVRFRRALELRPDLDEARTRLAYLLRRLGRPAEAERVEAEAP